MNSEAVLEVVLPSTMVSLPSDRVDFSPCRCFFEGTQEQQGACCRLWAEAILAASDGPLAFCGSPDIFRRLNEADPRVRNRFRVIVADGDIGEYPEDCSLPRCAPKELPSDISTVVLGEVRGVVLMRLRSRLTGLRSHLIGPEILAATHWKDLPEHAWVGHVDSIYPIDIPDIRFDKNLDVLLLDCPSRDFAWMPNGLAYVHNTLLLLGVKHQTFDLDIVLYHRFHARRVFDRPDLKYGENGKTIPEDPWMAEKAYLWEQPEFLKFFEPEVLEAAEAVIAAAPKILALSISGRNVGFSRQVVAEVRKRLPHVVVIVGGYSCYEPEIGLEVFPECDYMVVGEAEEVLPPLVKGILAGKDIPPGSLSGVLFNVEGHALFLPQKPPEKIDRFRFPQYDWADLELYSNYNRYKLTPIVSSRGCRWGRCRFCAEARTWRSRTPEGVVDEIEWLYRQGRGLFMFNESDFNGSISTVEAICRGIVQRNILASFTGQLRIDKRNTFSFFELLKQTGFQVIRFGVDGWTKNTLDSQRKGYPPKFISENLRLAKKAGLYVEVNTIVGVPGETEEDISRTIDRILENRKYIDRFATLNPLMLFVGSEYWRENERYGIVLHDSKENLIAKFGYAIPADMWHSEGPYIDQGVRLDRVNRIYDALRANEVNIAPMVKERFSAMKENRDKARGRLHENAANQDGQADATGSAETPAGVIVKSLDKFFRVRDGVDLAELFAITGGPSNAVDLDAAKEAQSEIRHQVRIKNRLIQTIYEGWLGYNIVGLDNRYCAVKRGYPVDWEVVDFDEPDTETLVKADTLFEIRERLAATGGVTTIEKLQQKLGRIFPLLKRHAGDK